MPIKSTVASSVPGEPHSPDDWDFVLGCFRPASGVRSEFFQHKTDQHLLSIAPTRTGKGRCLILPNLLHLTDHSVFVIDPKGENPLVSAKYRRDELKNNIPIFNPYRIFKKRV